MKLRTFAPPILMHLNVKFALANFTFQVADAEHFHTVWRGSVDDSFILHCKRWYRRQLLPGKHCSRCSGQPTTSWSSSSFQTCQRQRLFEGLDTKILVILRTVGPTVNKDEIRLSIKNFLYIWLMYYFEYFKIPKVLS